MNEHIITRQEFDKLYDDNILKREYDVIIKKIDKRFVEIMNNLVFSKGYYGKSYYGNAVTDGWDDCPVTFGFFDPKLYKYTIEVNNAFTELPTRQIPTRWLWESTYKDEYNKALEVERQKKSDNEKKIEEEEKHHLEIVNNIKSKLTEEELKHVLFQNYETCNN